MHNNTHEWPVSRCSRSCFWHCQHMLLCVMHNTSKEFLLLFSIHQLAVRFASVFMCQIISHLLRRFFFVQIFLCLSAYLINLFSPFFFCNRQIFREKKTIEVKMKTKYNVSLEHTYLGPVYSVDDRFYVGILVWFRSNSAKLMWFFFLLI